MQLLYTTYYRHYSRAYNQNENEKFWDVLKIPQAVLATPSHPGPSSTPKSPPDPQPPHRAPPRHLRSNRPQPQLGPPGPALPGPDLQTPPPRRLRHHLSFSHPQLASERDPHPFDKKPRPLRRPPCPAITRLKSILAAGFPTTRRQTHRSPPVANRDINPWDDLEYCPGCCHLRPRKISFWQRQFNREGHLRQMLRGPKLILIRVVVVFWQGKKTIECPECWAKAMLGPMLPQPQPELTMREPNLRDGYVFANMVPSFVVERKSHEEPIGTMV
ncbi:hypothetical protein PG988_016146 [Apiospora saccharicola]